MEERRVGSLMVVSVMVLGLVSGRPTEASFSDCYKGCFLLCVIIPGNSLFGCGGKCLKDCIFPSSINSLTEKQQTHYFCNFGCASTFCSNISSNHDPREEKVASCVSSCSSRCSKNYSP